MKGIRKNGFKGVAVAAALSMTMTTMVSPAATAIPTGRWEQSMQTGAGLILKCWNCCKNKEKSDVRFKICKRKSGSRKAEHPE